MHIAATKFGWSLFDSPGIDWEKLVASADNAEDLAILAAQLGGEEES